MTYEKCPQCHAHTLVFEPELNRWACLKLDCGYVEYKDGVKFIRVDADREDE